MLSIIGLFANIKINIHLLTNQKLLYLVESAWCSAHNFPGPVHVNLPLEEPLHPDTIDQQKRYRLGQPIHGSIKTKE